MNNSILIQKELAIRELEKRYQKERDDLYEYIKGYFREEKKVEFVNSWHYKVICDKLMNVFAGITTRLMINVPPRTGKTEVVTKLFTTWVLGNNHTINSLQLDIQQHGLKLFLMRQEIL